MKKYPNNKNRNRSRSRKPQSRNQRRMKSPPNKRNPNQSSTRLIRRRFRETSTTKRRNSQRRLNLTKRQSTSSQPSYCTTIIRLPATSKWVILIRRSKFAKRPSASRRNTRSSILKSWPNSTRDSALSTLRRMTSPRVSSGTTRVSWRTT